MDNNTSLVIMFAIAIFALVALNVAYWLIMRSDGTILTLSSSVIGGIIGYFVKKIKNGWVEENDKHTG